MKMKLTACYLLFLSVVTFELVSNYVSTVTSNPNYAAEVPSTNMPHILSKATNITVVEGQNVTFQCSVEELGELAVVWMKNNDVYFVNTHYFKKDPRFSVKGDMSIHIENVHATDAATYICQISSTPTIQLHHTLVVEVAPSAKTIPESGLLTVKLGDPITIGCDISGDPPPMITWTHSMKEITEYVQGGNIFIPAAKKEHAGVYECKVDNGVDIPSLGKIEVNVHYEPTIETPTKLIYTGEGARTEISCSVYGEPTPKVTWLKDNVKILLPQEHLKTTSYRHETRGHIGHTHRLEIRRVTSNYLGNYTCKAVNSLGHAFETIEVTGIPTPVDFKNGISDNKTDSYAMKWSVKSHSPVHEFKLKFRKRPGNGEEFEWTEVYIPAEKHPGLVQTHTYEITGLEPASEYEAIILTRNKFGWNNRSEIFIFKTEDTVIREDIEQAVIESNGSQESMVKTNDVTSSSITESRPNAGDNAGSLCRTTHIVTAVCIAAVFLW